MTPISTRHYVVMAALVSVFCFLNSTAAFGASIHFYKLNSKKQQVGYLSTKHADQPGCHNFKRKRKLSRVGQVGFAYCEVYSAKDCQSDSLFTFNWVGKKARENSQIKSPTQQITPGNMWAIESGQKNVIGRSWRCSLP